MVLFVLGLSVLVQLAAAACALRLIKTTGRRLAWTLIAAAICLMALRRAITLWRLASGDLVHVPDFAAEGLALAISVVMLAGIAFIGPLFRSFMEDQAELQRCRHVFLSAGWGIAVSSRDGKTIESMNPAFASMHGYSQEELVGRPIETILAPADRKKAAAIIQTVRERSPFQVECFHARKDGTLFPVTKEISVVRDEAGEILFHAVLVEDVTEHREAEEALRERENRLRLLLEQVPAILWTTDRELRITSGRGAGLKALGVAPDQFVGYSLSEYFHTDDPEFLPLEAQQRAIRGESVAYELDWLGRSFQSYVEPLYNDRGEITGAIGISLDVTGRRQAEAALRERGTRLRLLQEQMPAILWTTDRELRLTSTTGGGLRALGEEPNRYLGVTLADYFQNYDPEFVPVAMHRRAVAGESVAYELELSGRILHAYVEPLRGAGGKITGAIGIAHDITDRKRAEDALKLSHERLRGLTARLQEVREEERAAIAREIHDEVGQAMTALKLDLAWLRDNLPVGGEVRDRAQAMLSLVDGTIETARRLSSRLRPAILDELGLEAAVESLAREFAERTGCSCSLELRADGLDLDPTRDTAVFRIVQEALTNVARHAQASHVEIRLLASSGELVAEVQDDGRGITEKQVASRGALGLLGMRERARALGGDVVFRRAEEGGTVVALRLPRPAGEVANVP